MKTRAALLLLCAFAAPAEILDRIAVSVAKQVITERDVLLDVRVTAFLDHKPPGFSGNEKRAAADRLVDQLLILEEAATTKVNLSSDEDARKMLDDVKAQYGADYQPALARYRITERDVMNQLLAGLRALRFTDLRFRPEVQLSDEDLHDFYDSLARQWKQSGKTNIPSFDSSREQVEKLLTDQRTAQALDRWLGTRRTETQILYREQVFQ
jgi:FKBP-type peptidyl-prolyl cis-trans isomerase (trigger factor)